MHNNNTKCETSRCCDNCISKPFTEFKQVVNLKKSGLTVYIHENEYKEKRIEDKIGSVILYNTGERDLKRYDYISELCRYKTKCCRCIAIIQRVRSLLDNITFIGKYQILAICDYCKRISMRNKCKRCQYIINQFIKNKVQECIKHEEIFTIWLYKVQQLLTSITQGKLFCTHNVWTNFDLRTHLDNLLQHLKTSLPLQRPYIEIYPDKICLQSSENKMIDSQRILDDIFFKLRAHNERTYDIKQNLAEYVPDFESVCVCKYLKDNESKSTVTPLFQLSSATEFIQEIPMISSSEYDLNYSADNSPALPLINEKENNIGKTVVSDKQQRNYNVEDHINELKSHKENEKNNRQNKRIAKKKFNAEIATEEANKGAKFITVDHKIPYGIDEKEKPFQLILKLIEERDKEKKKNENHKIQDYLKLPIKTDIPITQTDKIDVDEDEASTMKCSETSDHKISEMIRGNEIVPYYESHQEHNTLKTPLLFQILASSTRTSEREQTISDRKIESETNNLGKEGLFFYKLSDRKFIENGWTRLPTTKIMRRINIYKMIPCKAHSDWFKCHLKQKILFHASGGKSAEVYESGFGKWFYENGDIALDYYNATGSSPGKKYIIYSSSESNIVNNKKNAIAILGRFDSFGNGIVYDRGGLVRLKYNQCEGLVIDKKISPPGRWKWHNLNEPPEIEDVFLDTKVEEDSRLQEYTKETDFTKEQNKEMVVLELQNFIKERAAKIFQATQKYKPFEIRMKTFKINDYFSLKIIDQSKIYLRFSCGGNYFKLNLGLLVKCNEIVDSELVEFGDVSTPYDRKISKSESDTNNVFVSDTKHALFKAKPTK